MKLWKCYNCLDDRDNPGREFFSDARCCPNCGLDADKEERFKSRIIPCVLIHFDPPHDIVEGRGVNKPACGAKKWQAMTGVPSVANCPACKRTDEFRQAEVETDEGEDFPDISIQITPDGPRLEV